MTIAELHVAIGSCALSIKRFVGNWRGQLCVYGVESGEREGTRGRGGGGGGGVRMKSSLPFFCVSFLFRQLNFNFGKRKMLIVSRVLHPHVTGMSRVCHGLDICHGYAFVTGYVTGSVTGLRGLRTGMSRDF